jgi:hypothetical protein
MQLSGQQVDLFIGGADCNSHVPALGQVFVLTLQPGPEVGQTIVDRLLEGTLDDSYLRLLLSIHLG